VTTRFDLSRETVFTQTTQHFFSTVQGRVSRWFVFKPILQFWYILEALGTEMFDIFYDILEYFVAICFISRQFGNSLKYPDFGTLCQEKSGNPGPKMHLKTELSGLTRKKSIGADFHFQILKNAFLPLMCIISPVHSILISMNSFDSLCTYSPDREGYHRSAFGTRVARFFLVKTYHNVKNIPNNKKYIKNNYKLYQTAINYSKWQ
jgi:hypothetical protein